MMEASSRSGKLWWHIQSIIKCVRKKRWNVIYSVGEAEAAEAGCCACKLVWCGELGWQIQISNVITLIKNQTAMHEI